MRTKTLLLLLSLAASPLFSQKLTFEAFVGGHYDFISDSRETMEAEFQSLRIINDSQAVRAYILQRYTVSEQYNAQPGYQFGTRTVWHIDQRTALMTGFTVAFRKFTRTTELPTITTLNIRTTTDTIALSLGGGGGIPFVYDNQYSDLNINENPPYTLFHLSIPLELRYTVMPWLRLKAGVYLATPIYSKRHIEDYRAGSKEWCTTLPLRQDGIRRHGWHPFAPLGGWAERQRRVSANQEAAPRSGCSEGYAERHASTIQPECLAIQ